MIGNLAAEREAREAQEAADKARQTTLARRMAIIRRLILFPLLAAALALIWYMGVLYGQL